MKTISKKTINKNTIEAIVRIIENADKQEQPFALELKCSAVTVAVSSSDGKIACPMDMAIYGDDADTLRLTTILSNSTAGFYQTNELDNAGRDIAREIFGEEVKRVTIWSRVQAKNVIIFRMIDARNFEESVNKTRNLFNLIDELYDNRGFIVTGIY